MSVSEDNTPVSTSTSITAAEEKNVPTLAEVVRNYKTKELIDFLHKEKDLVLDDDDLKIIKKEKITGYAFLKTTKEELQSYGMSGGPASDLADFVKELGKCKLKAFSSYKSLREVLKKYDIDGNETYQLKDEDDELEQCIREIKCRLGNMGTILADSNEAMCCEYISAILHALLYIVKRITNKELTLASQLEVVGEESTGRVDYAIKALEELICITEGKLHQVVMGFAQNLIQCESALQANKRMRKRKSNEEFMDDYNYIYGIVTTATEWYFILYTSNEISCTSKNPLNIRFTESVLKEGLEEEKELCKNMKRVMEVIVRLLKDRVDVEKEPVTKKQWVQRFFGNQE
ncbi:385_t:CDS:2 [Dentiscutata erythropus]|uniref:385_t:CDS:1 n=1 Tax=Dentiscutata erythropus TaxID=1348616 RepID=A0A9N9A3G6_9GLOM|nr:385_t:CDS:2 [Dentiscutata erythropus]